MHAVKHSDFFSRCIEKKMYHNKKHGFTHIMNNKCKNASIIETAH